MTVTDVSSEDIRIGSLRIHVARGSSDAAAGVLMYPSIMGIDAHVRDTARAFAAAGFTAVAWDPYNGKDADGEPLEMFARSRECEDRAVVRDLGTIVDYMHSELGVVSIFGIGWCFGGRVALIHAGSDKRVGLVSAYNPTIFSEIPVDVAGHSFSSADFPEQTLDAVELAAQITGPVQICRPEHDFTPTVVYQRLIDALQTRPDPTLYEFYPGADHGFAYMPGEANKRSQRFAWGSTMSLFSLSVPGN